MELFKLKRFNNLDYYYIFGKKGAMISPFDKRTDRIFNGDKEMFAFGEIKNNTFKIMRRLTAEELEKI